jgi:serine/threonine protein phosphatase PrpC
LAQRACAAFASRLVAEALPTLLLRALQGFGGHDAIGLLNELGRVLIEFSEKLRAHGEQRLHRSGMGTTLVLVLFHGPWTLLASVGDSRAYLDMAEQL